MDLSIVILNYNNREVALNCLESIKASDFRLLNREIILIDNASDDGLLDIARKDYPEVKMVRNPKNIGMGAGNNVGIRMAKGKYIAIMNPDTVASKDVFRKLYDYMEANPSVGMVGPKQLNPDGSVQDSCYHWYGPLTPVYRRTPLGRLQAAKKDIDRFLMKDFDHTTTKEVDWLLGSFLFCRKEALDQAGYFDEDFFLYFEDTDLARRFWQKKWKVVYNPEVSIIHNHSRMSARNPWYRFFASRAGREHVRSWFRYIKKWGIR